MPHLHRLLTWCLPWQHSLWPSHWPWARADAAHAQAAADQAGLLEELELLQLAQALQQQAQRQGGYAGEVFDLMIAIADLLESSHGWDPEQSDAWLERMGVWDWED
ncbi:hypothetical protein [Vulcanococcus limneticus]|uniref:hypothetical protein n=1 Tax=Vulcanococcus limneticus TaxID=2170428 RepID=UPI00398BDBF7